MQCVFRSYAVDPRKVAAEPDWARFDGSVVDIPAARGRYSGLLARWAQVHDLEVGDLDRSLDVEDWTENAVKLLAAIDAGLPVWKVVDDGLKASIEPFWNCEADFDHSSPIVFLGSFLRFDGLFDRDHLPNVVWPPISEKSGHECYWADPDLSHALKRVHAISSGNSGGELGYLATTRRLVESGADRLVGKIIFQAKYQAVVEIPLPRGEDGKLLLDDDSIETAFFEAFDVNLMDCDGREECFLLQERLEMIAEYRVVVIGGRPVCGAGTVEWLCPPFHDPETGAFDPLVEGKRSRRELQSRPDLAELYRREAEAICASMASRGEGLFEHCTMDFAIDRATGELCLVEVNPLSGSRRKIGEFGLYALDYGLVLNAILEVVKPVVEPAPAP